MTQRRLSKILLPSSKVFTDPEIRKWMDNLLMSLDQRTVALDVANRSLETKIDTNAADIDTLEAAGGSSAMVCTAYLQTTMVDGVLPDTTDNLVLLDNTLVNTGSKFDAGNNRITITDAGNYLVTAQLHLVMGNDVTCYLRVKDSDGNIKVEQLYRPTGVSGSGEPMTVSKVIAMSASKWLALYSWHASGANQVNGNAEANMTYPTYLSVIKV